MQPLVFTAYIVAFLCSLWLGSFLLARDWTRPALRNAGLGLLLYALVLAGLLVAEVAAEAVAQPIVRLANLLLFLPAILWAGTLAHLLPEEAPYRLTFIYGWRYLRPVLLLGFVVVGLGTEWIFSAEGSIHGPGYLIAGVVALLPLAEALALTAVGFLRTRPRRSLGVLLAALFFFTLSTTLLVIPVDWAPRWLLLVGIGVDLLLLGLAVAALDAFNEGEAWLPELLHSLAGAVATLLLFAAPVALTMRLSTGLTLPMTLLLLTISAAAIGSQTFRSLLQTWIDNLAYTPFPRLRQAQADLRSEAQVQVRRLGALDPASLDEEELARLTRRALSHFGNLPRLAANPLTQLVLVDQRLQAGNLNGETLERAAVLKQILVESIERLRPLSGNGDFHSTEEWRHFNALYYPYVLGLRPYSRRLLHDDLPPDAQAALDWFRVAVPERTLYNWQNAAAELIAKDLRERSR
jgi:hypothetical protein